MLAALRQSLRPLDAGDSFRLQIGRWIYRAYSSADLISFSPFDLRVYIRLTLAVLMWKEASQDYSALARIRNLPKFTHHTIPLVQTLSDLINRHILVTSQIVTTIQIAGIAACAFAFWRPSRISLIVAFATIALIEFPAFQWRAQNWDFDLPLAIMLKFIFSPCSLATALGTLKHPVYESNLVGRIVATYICGMYFAAGLAKLIFAWNWPFIVSIGNNWQTQFLDIAEYDGVSSIFGRWSSEFFSAFPILAAVIALGVLVDQLIMPFALIYRRVRQFAPAILFLNHVAVAATLGIFFASMPIVGPAIFVPWSGRSISPAYHQTSSQSRITCVSMIFAVILIIAPIINKYAIHPFANNLQFGWRYRTVSEYKTVYAVGYKDADGTFRPLPRGHGGFIESYLNVYLQIWAAQTATGHPFYDPKTNPWYAYLLCSWRPMGSNYWLLGPLSLPEHRFSQFHDLDLDRISTLYLLEGVKDGNDIPVHVKWTPFEEFPKPPCE
jgi:hypothetical protein